MKKDEIKAILFLHFYKEGEFIGQKNLWVEFSSGAALEALIGLLALGRKKEDDFSIEEFPSASKGYKEIKCFLERAYEQPFQVERYDADQVRVAQMTLGWSIEEPSLPIV